MMNLVIKPILNSGNACRNVFRRGINEVAKNEMSSMNKKKESIMSERSMERKKCLPLLILKIVFRAFSKEAKT
jgi:hypothetical protein